MNDKEKPKLRLLAFMFLALLLWTPAITVAGTHQNTLPETSSVQWTPKEAVRHYAEKYGDNPEIALRIVNCESGFDPNAQNTTSTARGLYQTLKSTFNANAKAMGKDWTYENDASDQDKNAELGAYLLSVEGTSPWNASKFCWI